MRSMPLITDQMVEEFRRTGKRRASLSVGQNGRSARKSARVAPQYYNPCAGEQNNVSCGEDCYCCDGFPKYGSPC
jgi:hypothetical protein